MQILDLPEHRGLDLQQQPAARLPSETIAREPQMPFIHAILLMGLALSNPAFAADKDGVHAERRLIRPAAEAAFSDRVPPLHPRGPGALFASVEAAAVDALTYAYLWMKLGNGGV